MTPLLGLARDDDGVDASVGALAASYDVLGEIGRGGSAVVYRARDRRLDRDVALKVVRLAPALAEQERAEQVLRLAREARTVARLEHPHIVTVYHVHELRDGLALSMQYVPGRTLKQLVADEGALDPVRGVRLLRDVAEALAYAHAHGVVHRDVKPENIFVDEATGRALLADFGAARTRDVDVRVTRTGATVGTPAYMSPEQIDGAPLDGRSDLYSLGLVAWEALTGRRPWADAGLYQLLHHQKHDALPPIAAVRPAGAAPVALATEYVVARLLEKRPGARWATADAVATQLDRPVLPADFRQWKRAHQRRLHEAGAHAAAGAGGLAAFVAARTERWHARPAPDAGEPAPAASAALDDGVPSWARTGPAGRRRWYAAAAAAALVLAAAAPLAVRARPAAAPNASTRAAGLDASPGPLTRAAMAGVVGPVRAPLAAPIAPAVAIRTSAAPAPRDSASAPPPVAARGAALGDTTPRVRVTLSVPVVAAAVARPLPAPVPAPPVPTPPAPVVVAPPAVATTAAVVVRAERAAVAAGGRHSCALDGGGRASCWGANESGQLGAGDQTSRDAPAAVAGDLRFTALAAGGAHSCALTADGDAYCWGDDDHGQLGDATASSRDAPVRVAGAWRFRALRAGLDHSCAVTAGGAVACWGDNGRGQLGDGTQRARSAPALVPGVRAAALALGWRHSCALAPDGQAYCWGDNGAGQLGDGTQTPRAVPVAVAGGRRFVAIAAGASHTCGVAAEGGTYCWGAGGSDPGTRATPAPVAGAPAFVELAAGSVHTCGRTASGQVYCWGRNPYGQLGAPGGDHWRPARVPGGPYTALSASGAHACAMAPGGASCWGYNVSGQLGDGTRAHRATPARAGASS